MRRKDANSSTDLVDRMVRDWLVGKCVLIADPGSSARTNIARAVQSMGARTGLIKTVSTFAAARQAIKEFRPEIVICDYKLGEQSGLQLLPLLRLIHPDGMRRVFILVTGNASESSVAEAAEEEVDHYVLKPFNHEMLCGYLRRVVLSKLRPDPFRERLEKGKIQLANRQYHAAIEIFTEASVYTERPALAYYYLGRTYAEKGELDLAEENFQAGLLFNPTHYRCLTGLFEVNRARGEESEAYEVLKRIVEHFPVSPQRLEAAVDLAVKTGHYEHIGMYYDIFNTLEIRPRKLAESVSTALIVGGKHSLRRNELGEAIDTFQKASRINKETGVLREIITALVEANRNEEAEVFLKEFPPELQGGVDYLSMDLLVGTGRENVAHTIDKARRLIAKGVRDPKIHETLIRASIQVGFLDSAEGLIYDAMEAWPEQRAHFVELERILQREAAARRAG